MVVYTTTDWSGWGKIASPIIREKFDDEITKYLGLYSSRLACFFSKQTEIDFCDLMYVLVCDKSYFTNMQRRIWILCVGYYLITKYGHLDFSCEEYKYYYLERITDIRNEVCFYIQGAIAKEFLTSTALFVGAVYAIYKAVC